MFYKTVSYFILFVGIIFSQYSIAINTDNNSNKVCQIDRKVLNKISGDRFIVQDFYNTGEKLTLPFVIEKAKKLIVCNNDNVPYYFDDLTEDSLGIIGELVILYKSGNEYSKQKFNAQGVRDGNQIYWYPSGVKKNELFYINGIVDGESISWYENGQKAQQFFYKNGKPIDTATLWYETGEKKEEISFYPDRVNKRWYKNGEKRTIYYFKNNKLYKVIKWDEHGKEIEVIKNNLGRDIN